jgi:alpha-tubulin suppressor-like RCC1 family protein
VQVEGRNTPTPLKVLARHSVSEMCLGPSHSSVLMDSGHLYTFGDNRYGQLGHGNLKTVESPACVKYLVDKHVMVGDRDVFTTDEDCRIPTVITETLIV